MAGSDRLPLQTHRVGDDPSDHDNDEIAPIRALSAGTTPTQPRDINRATSNTHSAANPVCGADSASPTNTPDLPEFSTTTDHHPRPTKRVRLADSQGTHPDPLRRADPSPSPSPSRRRKTTQMTSGTVSSANGNGQVAHESKASRSAASSTSRNVGNGAAETANYTGFRPIYPGSKIDRKELVRLTIQSLRELGYEDSARTLESEASITLEHPSIGAFRTAVLNGDWRNAERLLIDGLNYSAAKLIPQNGASDAPSTSASTATVDYSEVLRDPVNRPIESIRFLLQQQRYLELLEGGQVQKALSILRERLTPLHHGTERLHQLSSLVMCDSPEQLRMKANWAGSGIESRRKLLEDVELSVSPTVMLPSRRLPQLLDQAQTLQKQQDPYFNLPLDTHVSLYSDHHSDRSVFPTQTTHVLRGHTDEVWVMAFNHDGNYLATGGKDKKVIIWSISSEACEKFDTIEDSRLTGAVTALAWSHDGKALLIGSDDTLGYCWLDRGRVKGQLWSPVHDYSIYGAVFLPNGTTYVTSSLDGDVHFYSIPAEGDEQHTITHTWQMAPWRVLSLAVTPNGKYIVALGWRPADTAIHSTSAASAGEAASSLRRATSTSTTSSSRNSYTSESASPMSSAGQSDPAITASTSRGAAGSQRLGLGAEDAGSGGTEARSKISFYDIAKREEVAAVYSEQEMTSVAISSDSRFAIVNRRPNDAQLWDIENRLLLGSYSGHSLAQHMVRACFGGSEQSFVASGSEDSCVYVWHRSSGTILARLRGHGYGTVNTVAWHPKMSALLASCSDDHTVRIWQPATAAASPDLAEGGTTAAEVTRTTIRSRFGPDVAASTQELAPFPWSMSPARAASPEGPADLAVPLVFLSSDDDQAPSGDGDAGMGL